MEITGKIIAVLPLATGQGKTEHGVRRIMCWKQPISILKKCASIFLMTK
jgi:hypothetical protein